ncbi:MAG: hypothetical protein CMJ80_07180 [Planctomycetaceae bacterium]|nr:hypothetical protein [Planctomycetaceae bacterium]
MSQRRSFCGHNTNEIATVFSHEYWIEKQHFRQRIFAILRRTDARIVRPNMASEVSHTNLWTFLVAAMLVESYATVS